MDTDTMSHELAEAFCRWPLPDSVRADDCALHQGPGRYGTSLLSYIEARQFMQDVVAPKAEAATCEAELDELATYARRLVRLVRKADPTNKVAAECVEFLRCIGQAKPINR